jgi:hypothetical protein
MPPKKKAKVAVTRTKAQVKAADSGTDATRNKFYRGVVNEFRKKAGSTFMPMESKAPKPKAVRARRKRAGEVVEPAKKDDPFKFYDVLGVNADASSKEIDKAAEDAFELADTAASKKKVQNADKILGTTRNRAIYDKFLRGEATATSVRALLK